MKLKTPIFVLLILFLFAAPALGEGIVEWDPDDIAAVEANPLDQARMIMRQMTDEEKIGQLLIVAPEDLTGERITNVLSDPSCIARLPVGGVILYGQNIASEMQLKTLIQDLNGGANAAGLYPLFIAVDEEGGSVARVAHKIGLETGASPTETGASGQSQMAYQNGRIIGHYLNEYGFNLNFAPVADVLIGKAPDLEGRTYGTDAQFVAEMALNMASGLQEEGIIPCYKHFPGHGALDKNAHYAQVRHNRSLTEMKQNELIPFQAAIDNGAEMIMLSHLTASAVDKQYPVPMSSLIVTGLLREEMGFDGVVITDALRMNALREGQTLKAAVIRMLNAGVDILLAPGDGVQVFGIIKEAVKDGKITMERIEESVARVLALKIKSGLIQ